MVKYRKKCENPFFLKKIFFISPASGKTALFFLLADKMLKSNTELKNRLSKLQKVWYNNMNNFMLSR